MVVVTREVGECAGMEEDLFRLEQLNELVSGGHGIIRSNFYKTVIEGGGRVLITEENQSGPVLSTSTCSKYPDPENGGSYWGRIESVGTHPHYRRRGLAAVTVGRSIELARKDGVDYVWLAAAAPGAKKLYSKLGFEASSGVYCTFFDMNLK